MSLVIQTHPVNAPEIDRSKQLKRCDLLIGHLKIAVFLFQNSKGLALLVKATEPHGSSLIQVTKDPHLYPCSISKR